MAAWAASARARRTSSSGIGPALNSVEHTEHAQHFAGGIQQAERPATGAILKVLTKSIFAPGTVAASSVTKYLFLPERAGRGAFGEHDFDAAGCDRLPLPSGRGKHHPPAIR